MPRMRSVPAPRTRFVGRRPELDGLHALLNRSRLVSIVGPGGCGKTRLALELLADRPGPVTLVALAAVGRDEDVVGAFLEPVGGREDPLRDPIDQIVDLLSTEGHEERRAPSPMLLVDNAEHLLDPVATLIDGLLTRVDNLSVAVTTREPLGVVGEAVYRVPPMALPVGGADATTTRSCDAVALFLDRAALVRPDRPLADGDLDAVAEICRRLDGLPLAIELAAARLPLLAPDRIAAGLDDRFRLLVIGNRTALPRQRTLEGCVDWSYSLLSIDEQRLLDRLAVFRGSFTTAGVAAVATSAVAADLVLELLDRLVAKSLVVADPRPDGTRFRLLETIAAYAAARLEAEGGGDEARDRLAEHVDALTEPCDHELTGPEQDRLLHRLREDEDTIRDALDHLEARAVSDPHAADLAWRIIGRLTFFWLSAGRFREASARFGAVAAHPPLDPRTALAARWGAAHLATYAGDFDHAVTTALDVLTRSEELGDDRHAGRALDTLACMELFVDPERSLVTLGRAIELADRAGDRWCGADSRQVLAYVQLIRHELDAAEAALDDSIGAARDLDHPLLLAWDGLGRAMIAFERGQATAEVLTGAARQVARTDDPNLSAQLVSTEALAAFQRGAVRPWIEQLERSAIEGRRSEAGLSFPTTIMILLLLLIDAGELLRAEAVIDELLADIVASAPAFAERLLALAALAALAGDDLPLSQERIRAAEAAAVTASRGGQALVAVVAAHVAWRGGDLGTAESRAAGAVETLAALGARPALVDAVEVLALVHHGRGDPGAAQRLADAARHERQDLGLERTELQVVTGPDLARVLGPPAEVGAEPATLDDVVAWVQRSRGERRRPSVGWASLTPTELQVAALIAAGCTNAQAAERLFVSAATVKTHLAHIFRKLDVVNRSALTAAYLANTVH